LQFVVLSVSSDIVVYSIIYELYSVVIHNEILLDHLFAFEYTRVVW